MFRHRFTVHIKQRQTGHIFLRDLLVYKKENNEIETSNPRTSIQRNRRDN